ncbi:T9SS type A sorting domain-containing protein [Adhaeribacter soli]|nr:T9SS type A sorting domain-containing protein [Adhaeribacter soli]
MYKLPELTWQNTFNSPFKVYDFQPNDRFSYYKKEANSTFYEEEWYQNKILTRRNSPGGDSIYYTIEHRKLSRRGLAFSQNPNPGPFTLAPPVIQDLIITEHTNPELYKLTNEFSPGSPFFQSANRAQVNVAIKKQTRYHQREVFKFTDYSYTAGSWQNCGSNFGYTPDVERYVSYGAGLGKVYDFSIDSWPMLTWDSLQAYVKGSETYGTWVDFTQIMGTDKEIKPVPFSAYPNPFTEELSLRFDAAFKAGTTTISIQNTLGQEVFSQRLNAIPNQETKLNLPHLAKGLYVVQVTQHGKVYTSRLVKE